MTYTRRNAIFVGGLRWIKTFPFRVNLGQVSTIEV